MVESNQNQDSNLGSRLQQDLKNDLIAGLLVVIPLATTIWLSSLVSKFVLTLVTSVPKQLNPFITLNPLLQDLINLTLGLTVPLLAILLIGLMARNFVGRWLLEFGEGTLSKIPVAGAVYKTLKQLLETFLSNKSNFDIDDKTNTDIDNQYSLIKNLSYFSKDNLGNEYIIESKYSEFTL